MTGGVGSLDVTLSTRDSSTARITDVTVVRPDSSQQNVELSSFSGIADVSAFVLDTIQTGNVSVLRIIVVPGRSPLTGRPLRSLSNESSVAL